VWAALTSLRFGETTHYSDLAASLGRSSATRAVGSAVARNCLAIIVPCHRVVGKDGDLTGYAWGVWRKERLLKHEQNELIEYHI
jgi:methylated-DNA-[protein]-cysteine S-methyltransferase